MEKNPHFLRLRRIGIDTYQEPVIYMREDCTVCKSEGFQALSRVKVEIGSRFIIATLNVVRNKILAHDEAGLSEAAWKLLSPKDGEFVRISHPKTLESLSFVRSKVYGNELSDQQIREIVQDVAAGRYADVHLASFLTAGVGERLNDREVTSLTRAMIDVGENLDWGQSVIVDKHCVGGLPGNRTTPIIVAIVTACGLIMPKTSSRAITSPAGTADTMETLAPVDLDLPSLRRVVEKEGGCIAWGGSVRLSPADDIFIRVERVIDIDSEGQMVASILSKKIAAGSTHVVIDMPVGPTAKVRDKTTAETLDLRLQKVAENLDLKIKVLQTDGIQPVGRGIGPALEAKDVLSVLQRTKEAPQDLRERALFLAGHILEMGGVAKKGEGLSLASKILDNGSAWKKFQAICQAQGGMREPPTAEHRYEFTSPSKGIIRSIDNRRLARVARLAGAPSDPAAGIMLHARVGSFVEFEQPIFTLHSQSPGELVYAQDYLKNHADIVEIQKDGQQQ